MKKLFRTIIAVNITCFLMWFFVPYFWGELYGAKVLDALSWNAYGAIFSQSPAFSYAIAALHVAAAVGMWFMRNWARSLFIFLVVSSLLTTPLFGIVSQTGYEAALSSLITISDGFLIAIMLLSTINIEFSR